MGYIKQNFVSGQTLKADHLNHIEDGIIAASNCDWNLMKNKPFEEKKALEDITWDGNTDGLESANTGMMIYCYKMPNDYSHLEPTDFIGATFKNPDGGNQITITEEHISDDGLSVVVEINSFVVFAFIKEGGTANYIGSNAGVWLCKTSGGSYTDVVSFPSEIKTIDPKYLPNTGGVFVVNFICDEEGNYSADKTYDEVLQAVEGDIHVIGRYKYTSPYGFIDNYLSLNTFTGNGFNFYNFEFADGTLLVYQLSLLSTNQIDEDVYEYHSGEASGPV